MKTVKEFDRKMDPLWEKLEGICQLAKTEGRELNETEQAEFDTLGVEYMEEAKQFYIFRQKKSFGIIIRDDDDDLTDFNLETLKRYFYDWFPTVFPARVKEIIE